MSNDSLEKGAEISDVDPHPPGSMDVRLATGRIFDREGLERRRKSMDMADGSADCFYDEEDLPTLGDTLYFDLFVPVRNYLVRAKVWLGEIAHNFSRGCPI